MTLQISATPHNGLVLMEIQGANGAKVAAELTAHQAAELILSLGRAVMALPYDPAIPLNREASVLRATNPSFQVGIASSGNALLAVKPGAFPSVEFEFETEPLSKLIDALRKAAIIPQQRGIKPS